MKKKLICLLLLISSLASLTAQQYFWVFKKDGSTVPFSIAEVDSISFNPKSTPQDDPEDDPEETPCTPVNVANNRNNYCFATSNANNGTEGFCYVGSGFTAINMCNENYTNGNNLLGSTANTNEVAVMVDLGDTYNVSSFKLFQGSTNANYPSSYCSAYTVYYSTSEVNTTNKGAVTWVQAARYTNGAIYTGGSIQRGNATATTDTGDIITLAAPVSARSVKFVFDKNACKGTGNTAGTVSIVSLQVFGCTGSSQGGGGGQEQGGGEQDPTGDPDPVIKGDHLDILFIGNSLTYYNNLAKMFEDVANLRGHDVTCTAATNGGKNLIFQSTADNVVNAIKKGGYEIVFLQDIVGSFNAANLETGATAVINVIKQYNPNAKIMFYAPWPTSGNLTGANSTLPYVTSSYAAAARSRDAKLAPAGEAFFDLFYNYGYNWYDDDRHPQPYGTFVSVSTIYYTVFGDEACGSFKQSQYNQLNSIMKSHWDYSGKGHLDNYDLSILNLIFSKGCYYAKAVAPSVADKSGNTTYTSVATQAIEEGKALVAKFSTNANLAKGKTATASSGTASLAVDGQTNTRWESTQGVDPQWISIDLGSAQTFSKVAIMWEAAYASKYTIQTSTNGTDWTTKQEVTATFAQTIEHNIGSTTARYVRIYGTQRGTGYGYSIYELGIW